MLGTRAMIREVRESRVELRASIDRNSDVLDRHSEVLDRHNNVLDRQSEVLGRNSDAIRDLREVVDDLRIALRDMNHRSELVLGEMAAQLRALNDEFRDSRDERRAQTQATLRLLDRWGDGPSAAGA